MNDQPSPLIKAIDLNHNKFVQACAGAGKTFALSKRYCAILDDFVSRNTSLPAREQQGPENILVITFTNQAAAEMAERIYKDLNQLLKGEEISPFKEQGFTFGENLRIASEEYKNRLRSAFSANAISTIDSFCAGVLKNNAHKIGLDPRFKIGDDVLSRKKFTETLDAFLLEKGRQFDENLACLFNGTSAENISVFIDYIYQNRAFLDSWLEEWKQLSLNDNEFIKQKWIDEYTPIFDEKQVGIENIGQVPEINPAEQYPSQMISPERIDLGQKSQSHHDDGAVTDEFRFDG